MNQPHVILASASKARANMLRGAGLDFKTIPADIDESQVQQNGSTPEIIAEELAQQKALHIAKQNPNALVIGSDQVLECEGQLLHKSSNAEEALDKLRTLNGKTHRLISAVALVQGESIIWSTHDIASLTMNTLTEVELSDYIARAGAALTSAVGGYWLEDIGAWLFEHTQGDYFTILGMPLLPLLNQLRTQHGVNWR